MKTSRILNAAALTLASMIPLHSMAANEVFLNGQSIYGQAAAGAAASRVIDLTKNQRPSVAYGETVVFKSADGKQFAWTFNGLEQRDVKLSKIAPSDFKAGQASVLVGSNPVNVNY